MECDYFLKARFPKKLMTEETKTKIQVILEKLGLPQEEDDGCWVFGYHIEVNEFWYQFNARHYQASTMESLCNELKGIGAAKVDWCSDEEFDFFDTLDVSKPEQKKVVIHVNGGVAELISAPQGVKVEIVDHDLDEPTRFIYLNGRVSKSKRVIWTIGRKKGGSNE